MFAQAFLDGWARVATSGWTGFRAGDRRRLYDGGVHWRARLRSRWQGLALRPGTQGTKGVHMVCVNMECECNDTAVL